MMILFLVPFLILTEALPSTVGYYNNKNSSICPPWFILDDTTQQCECGNDLDGKLYCDNRYKSVDITDCFCMTHGDALGTVAGECITNCFNSNLNESERHYYHLPSNLTELNKVMCEDHWNRGGRLCGKCKDGYHPLVYSYNVKCVECKDANYNWLSFIVAAFIPLTFFFILVVSCEISASSPKLEAFVVYAQIVATPANARIVREANTTEYNPNTAFVTQIILALYGIWNLDFFRTLLPPVCLKINTLQALALDYLIAFYPLVLIVITYVLIDLYDKLCVLVWLWKPLSNLLKGSANVKPGSINAFIIFLILSYVKLLSVSFNLLVYVNVYNSSGESVGTYLFYDASIKYFGREHLPYAIIAILVVIAFIALPLIFSLLHPLRCFNGCIGRWPSLRICLDSFQGYYKDGTDGDRDCRWFSSLYLFVRIALFLVYGLIKKSFYQVACILLIILVALIIAFQPFKPQYGVYNTIHALHILNLAILFMIAIYSYDSMFSKSALVLSAIVTILPLLYATGLVSKWICSREFCRNHFISKFSSIIIRKHSHTDPETDSIDSVPYRAEHEHYDEEEVVCPDPIDGDSSTYGTFG